MVRNGDGPSVCCCSTHVECIPPATNTIINLTTRMINLHTPFSTHIPRIPVQQYWPHVEQQQLPVQQPCVLCQQKETWRLIRPQRPGCDCHDHGGGDLACVALRNAWRVQERDVACAQQWTSVQVVYKQHCVLCIFTTAAAQQVSTNPFSIITPCSFMVGGRLLRPNRKVANGSGTTQLSCRFVICQGSFFSRIIGAKPLAATLDGITDLGGPLAPGALSDTTVDVLPTLFGCGP